jgi:hypothetical protein
MQTFSHTLDSVEDYTFTVTVHGLKRRASLARLVMALASIPCFPSVIFKIDRSGKLLGVMDHKGFTYYVQVRHWGKDPDRLPDIGWTTDPGKLSRGLSRRASKQYLDYTSAVRSPPLILTYSSKAHFELCARMAVAAS